MARRVGKNKGVAQNIGVSVELLRIGGVGDEGIGREEPANAGQIEASVVVDEAQGVVVFLPCVASVCKGLGGAVR